MLYINAYDYLFAPNELLKHENSIKIAFAIGNQNKLFELEHHDIFRIVNSFHISETTAAKQLFYRLEPYILKNIKNFELNQLLNILNVYLKWGLGSNDLISSIFANISVGDRLMKHGNVKTMSELLALTLPMKLK